MIGEKAMGVWCLNGNTPSYCRICYLLGQGSILTLHVHIVFHETQPLL